MTSTEEEKPAKMAHFEVDMDGSDHSHDRKSLGQKIVRTGSAFTKSTRAWVSVFGTNHGRRRARGSEMPPPSATLPNSLLCWPSEVLL